MGNLLQNLWKKGLLLCGIGFLFAAVYIGIKEEGKEGSSREAYEEYLAERSGKDPEVRGVRPDEEPPGPAMRQHFLATMDPTLKRPTPEAIPRILARLNEEDQGAGRSSTAWTERGPDNVGGRTRAIMFDPNDGTNTKVWAGGVTGGLWYNSDITSSSSSWQNVNDFWKNIAVTCIAYDPNDPQTFYVGTGEQLGGGTSRGQGIWKSTDGGSSWNQIASTDDFYYVNDLAVRDESGSSTIYAAVSGAHYMGVFHTANEGLQRSTDGGSTWSQVLPDAPNGAPYAPADIEIGADNTIWVGSTKNIYSGADAGARGGGRVFFSDNGTGWTDYTPSGENHERVEVAVAPSDGTYAYAVMEGAGTEDSEADTMLYTTDGGKSWNPMNMPDDADNGIPSDDFSRGQAYYDLILKVDPNDKNTVYAGAINLHRSTDNGSSWSQISKWSNNPDMDLLNCSIVHADQHEIVFRNGSSDEAVFGTDGGIFFTNDLSNAASSDVFEERNTDYNVTQFYACAIHPTSGQTEFLGGTQDNGTQRFTQSGMNSTSTAVGGDGAYCFIDKDQPQYQIVSYTYNNYYRSTDGGSSWSQIQSKNTGSFINPAAYDHDLDVLFSARGSSSLNRLTDVTGSPTESPFSVSLGSMASAFEVSPHTTGSTKLFVGTQGGRLFRLEGVESGSPSSSTEITGGSFPSGTISSIQVGSNDDELLVTFSNYGVNSVWYSSDGGSNWSSKEGDLPNMPVHWALFDPGSFNEILLATEVGVWMTHDLSKASPDWFFESSGVPKVRVDMLRRRRSDEKVYAATHGRGIFSASSFTPLPLELLSFEAKALEERVRLRWRTASEQGSERFYVQRSEKGEQFRTIDTLKGSGTSAEQQAYSSTDEIPLEGDSYYRLLIVDRERDTIRSGTEAVRFGEGIKEEKEFSVSVHPNPVEQDRALLKMKNGVAAEKVLLRLFDGQGRPVLRKRFEAEGRKVRKRLNLPGELSGNYILQVEWGNERTSERLIIR